MAPARPNRPSVRDSASARPATRLRARTEAAVRTLIEWAGDDPAREALAGTPERVLRAYREFFGGYGNEALDLPSQTVAFDDLVVVRGLRVESHCEHHMAPIVGIAHIGYLPRGRILASATLADVVDRFAKRLQLQEALTAQIADAIDGSIHPAGVGVIVEARHHCMTTRGVHQPAVNLVTQRMIGAFRDDAEVRRDFLALVRRTAARPPAGCR